MIMIIIKMLQILIISYVLSDLGDFIGSLIGELNQVKNKALRVSFYLLQYVLTCPKCFSFWFSLIMSGDLFIASVIAIIINTIKEFEYKRKKVTEL